jgi:hypothetical protein
LLAGISVLLKIISIVPEKIAAIAVSSQKI